jgi:hypothetical protein
MIKTFRIQPYGALLYVVVEKTAWIAQEKLQHIFGKPNVGEEDWAACCVYQDGEFAAFFGRPVTMENLAHEMFHVTHRILEHAQVNVDHSNHEAGAYPPTGSRSCC